LHLYSKQSRRVKLGMDHMHEDSYLQICNAIEHTTGICNAKIYEQQQFLRNHSNHIKLKLTKFRKK
jgi:hypothetical protein